MAKVMVRKEGEYVDEKALKTEEKRRSRGQVPRQAPHPSFDFDFGCFHPRC
jgi:hypothetical protein